MIFLIFCQTQDFLLLVSKKGDIPNMVISGTEAPPTFCSKPSVYERQPIRRKLTLKELKQLVSDLGWTEQWHQGLVQDT